MFATRLVNSVIRSSNIKLVRLFNSEYTKHFLMPAAARLVALNNLDASSIVGTGLGGRIMRYDVVKFMESNQGGAKNQPAATSAAPKKAKKVAKPVVPAGNGVKVTYEDSPISGETKSKMDLDQQMKKTIPHCYLKSTLSLTNTLQLIKTLSTTAATPLSLTDFAVKAISNALVRERSLPNVDVNISLALPDCSTRVFTLPQVQKLNILDIHNAIQKVRDAPAAPPATPLTGIVTVNVLDSVVSAGGILSWAQELGTVTVGSPVRSVEVDEEEKMSACVKSEVDFTFNAVKLSEVEGYAVLGTFKKMMETPEFLLE